MDTTTAEADTQTPARVLTVADRCDSCGAQAYIAATFLNGELLFCGHHGRAYSAKMAESALSIHDQTADLSTKRQGM
jgi:hypothetical protein